ncbi:MAG: DUF1572 domain-containing protein [Bacteroidia bacterium]
MDSENYLESIKKQFLYYKSLGQKAMDQVPDEKLFWQYNMESNSIAIIVKHLSGNMLSRWTDFLTSDGEKEWRQRDGEFENDIQTRDDLMKVWNKGWDCLEHTLNSLTADDLTKTVYIRNQGCTAADAINRQLAHYPYHIGQIVFIAKMIEDGKWKSLSIPKNQSAAYNSEKFSQPKEMKHFTDEYLKKDKK